MIIPVPRHCYTEDKWPDDAFQDETGNWFTHSEDDENGQTETV